MPERRSAATDLDLISYLKAIPGARMRRGDRIPAWYLLLVAVLGILSGVAPVFQSLLSTCAPWGDGLWFWLAKVITDGATPPEQADSAPPPLLLDRQGWSALLARALLLLISFTTYYCDDNLLKFGDIATLGKEGMGIHLAALAALAGDGQLVTQLRHRAANEAARTERARQQEADSRKREALRAGALFLLQPSPLNRDLSPI